MRILVLNHNLRERGTWFRARKTARALHARGHDVTFVCTGEGYYRPRRRESEPGWREWESANWTPLREAGDGWSPLGLLQRLASLRGRWDLVYTFSHLPVDQGVARLVRRHARFWITDWCDLWDSTAGGLHDVRLWQRPLPPSQRGVRGMLVRTSFRLEDALERGAARDADAVSIIASPMRRYTRRLGVPDARVHRFVSGADTERIRPLDRGECRARLGLPADALVLGYVANATPDNRQLEEALELAWRRLPELRVFSVGPRWYADGGVVSRAVAEGRLKDFDRRPFAEIPSFLGAADFLVMPLTRKLFNLCRWPHKFGDYMASGRATATCDVGDMGKTVRRLGVGVAGEATAEGLAGAIVRLAEDGALRRDAGEAASRAALGLFSWERQIEGLCEFLRGRGVREI